MGYHKAPEEKQIGVEVMLLIRWGKQTNRRRLQHKCFDVHEGQKSYLCFLFGVKSEILCHLRFKKNGRKVY